MDAREAVRFLFEVKHTITGGMLTEVVRSLCGSTDSQQERVFDWVA